jgi:KTSC domain-containing protein
MKLKPVESEMLVAVGYDEKLHSLMAVFRTGETYRYKNVPSFVYERLMSADSIGKFMHKYVLNRFDYERVTTTAKFRGKLKHG